MFVFKVGIVGAGTMGAQIAQAVAAAGIPVVLSDASEEALAAGVAAARAATERRLAALVERGRLDPAQASAQSEEVLGRITATTGLDGFGDVDLAIEAVPERLELKHEVLAALDAATPGRALLASNTSALSISELADATLRPELVLGMHFFYPAAVMPLVEVVAGEETATEAVRAAVAFALAIRKQPIVCADAPGFVVNRVLVSALSELWRAQEAGGLSIAALDAGLVERNALPVGPFALADRLGLDTVLSVAELLADAHGERFHVPAVVRERVAAGRLGAKTGGEGLFLPDGAPAVAGEGAGDVHELAELIWLKALVEGCLLLQEGVATHREIDAGMVAGAGLDPRRGLSPPFARADAEGLDVVLARLERAAAIHGERFAAPTVLRRLVAQGRLGAASGQGFYAYPRPDAEQPGEGSVLLESRGEVAIAWLASPPMNAIGAALARDLRAVWERVEADGARALVLASANPTLFCAGADVTSFGDAADARALIGAVHELTRAIERSPIATIAAINGLALGGGNELAMACDVRIAARSAMLGQPEIKLGLVPGFGGTQRLARLVGPERALELNLVGEPIGADEAHELGLVTRVVDDHELLDVALAWARRLAEQAPLALAQIKRVSAAADLDVGLAAEAAAFVEVAASEDAREGVAAFLGRRRPRWRGR